VLTGSRDRVRTLRAIGTLPDALAFRRHVERALGGVSLHTSSLSPQAIVCVRRLRMPAPSSADARWTAVESAMPPIVARAVRPFGGAVPASADVVVFLDEVELLACLARDWCRGEGDTWWWRSLFGGAASAALVVRSLTDHPSSVPAAFARLADARIASDFVRALPSASCDEISTVVAATFAVREWRPTSPATRPLVPKAVSEVANDDVAQHAVARLEALLAVVPKTDVATLAPSQRALLGLALVLSRAPALAHQASIVARLSEGDWSIGAATAGHVRPMTLDRPHHSVATALRPMPQDTSYVSQDEARPDPGRPLVSGPEVPKEGSAERQAVRSESPPTLDFTVTPTVADVRAGESSTTSQHEARASEVTRDLEVSVASEFAGLFYLVNIALHLELFSDFTQPGRPGLALHVGDFLALAGERICGPPIRRDAIWEVLARVAGRETNEPPGPGFHPPDGSDIDIWLTAVLDTFASAAARALGMSVDSALFFLCARTGRLTVAATRLTIAFPLADHPLDIRMAGLDRDPGWVPAAGRAIAFEFE
jgi:hypothetical protein